MKPAQQTVLQTASAAALSAKQLQPALDELAYIKDLVHQHGLYVIKLNKFILEASNRDDIMYGIILTAKQADLKVSFNFKQGLCVFERDL